MSYAVSIYTQERLARTPSQVLADFCAATDQQLREHKRAEINWNVFALHFGWSRQISERAALFLVEATLGEWMQERGVVAQAMMFGAEKDYPGMIVIEPARTHWKKPRRVRA